MFKFIDKEAESKNKEDICDFVVQQVNFIFSKK